MNEFSDSAETHARPPSHPVPAASRFTPGTVLAGRFRIVAALGRGGMGDVYRADDLRVGQAVALKFLPQRVAGDPEKLARLYSEVRVGRQVSHPNVCRLYDIIESDGDAFIAMEYIDGEDLASLIRRIGRLPESKAVSVSREIASGLAAAHALGVVHRDLKPANVMIDGRGTARITDFGLAVVGEEDDAGAIAGTPAYMAPEQLAGEVVTPKTDIYAFGVTMYEIFTGKRRFEGRTLDEIRSEHASASQVSRDTAGIDAAMQRVIVRCLEEDPARRPSSMHAVIAAMPGGDPLQAAIDAGETPSPEMIAAAGESGELRPAVAWPLLVATMLLLAIAFALAARTNFTSTVKLPQPPDALTFKARELIRTLAPDAPANDTVHRFRVTTNEWSDRRKYVDSDERVAALRPPAAIFYYRQSPRQMIAIAPHHARSENDPPFTVPSMVHVALDPDGYLLAFKRLPLQTAKAASAPNVDWTQALAATGLTQWQAVPPEWTPPVGSERRYAWTAIYPGQPRVPIRVEAASFHGKPVWLEVIPPWRRPVPPVVPEAPLLSRISNVAGVVLTLMTFAVAATLALRNLRRGRADAKAATRVAVFILAAAVIGDLLHADHSTNATAEFNVLVAAVSSNLFWACVTWASYMALEPYLRRRWPRMLIAWRRVIDGRFSDAMVGRETLAGVLLGAVMGLGWLAAAPLASLVGSSVPRVGPSPAAIEGPLHYFELFAAGAAGAVGRTLGMTVILLIAHVVLRNRTASVIALGVLLSVVGFRRADGMDQALMIGVNVVLAIVFVMTLTRRGLFTAVVAAFVLRVVVAPPITLDTSDWFFWRAVVAMLITASLAFYGFVQSFGTQPIFSGAVLDE